MTRGRVLLPLLLVAACTPAPALIPSDPPASRAAHGSEGMTHRPEPRRASRARPTPSRPPTPKRPRVRSTRPVNVSALLWRIALCESGGNPRAVSRTGKYRGLVQFSMATWRSVGGKGDPIDASVAEQLHRAAILLRRSGINQWPHCGPRALRGGTR